MIDLGNHFSDFDLDNLETYSLPRAVPAGPVLVLLRGERPAGPERVRGLHRRAQPVQATVTVLNATIKEGFARDISGALQRIGFELTEPDTTEPAPLQPSSTPGQANATGGWWPATSAPRPRSSRALTSVPARWWSWRAPTSPPCTPTGADRGGANDYEASATVSSTTTDAEEQHSRRRPAHRRPRPRPKSTRSSSANHRAGETCE